MSLDLYLEVVRPSVVYERNITHNLTAMAAEAGVYKHLWRPEDIGVTQAHELIDPLTAALAALEADEPRFRVHDAKNGWGRYEHFVEFVRDVLAACKEYPEATVRASR